MTEERPPVRYYFGGGRAIEPVKDRTYRAVDAVDGAHKFYLVAEAIEYAPTIEAQLARMKRQ